MNRRMGALYEARVKALPMERVLGVYRELYGQDRGNTLEDIQALIEQDWADYPEVAFIDVLPTDEERVTVVEWEKYGAGRENSNWRFFFGDGEFVDMKPVSSASMDVLYLNAQRRLAALDHIKNSWKENGND